MSFDTSWIRPFLRRANPLYQHLVQALGKVRLIHCVFIYDLLTSLFSLGVSAQILGHSPWALSSSSYMISGLIQAAFLFWTQSYKACWRWVTVLDLATLLKTAVLSVLITFSFLHHVLKPEHLTLWAVLTLSLQSFLWLAPRCLYVALSTSHHWFLGLHPHKDPLGGKRVLWVGDTLTISTLLNALPVWGQETVHSLGIVASHPFLTGQTIHGVPLLGTVDTLPLVITQLDLEGHKPQALWFTPQTLSQKTLDLLQLHAQSLHIPLEPVPEKNQKTQHVLPSHALTGFDIPTLLGREALKFSAYGIQSLLYHKRLVMAHVDQAYWPFLESVLSHSPKHILFLDHDPKRLQGLQNHLRHTAWFPLCQFLCVASPDQISEDILQGKSIDLLFFFPPHRFTLCDESLYAHAVWSYGYWMKALADLGIKAQCPYHLLITPDDRHLGFIPFESALWRCGEMVWKSMPQLFGDPSLASRFLTFRVPEALYPQHPLIQTLSDAVCSSQNVLSVQAYEQTLWVSAEEMQHILSSMLSLIPRMNDQKTTLCVSDVPAQPTIHVARRVWSQCGPEARPPTQIDLIFPTKPYFRSALLERVEPSPLRSLGHVTPSAQSLDAVLEALQQIYDQLLDLPPQQIYDLLCKGIETPPRSSS